ncbi:MAG: hypothetical protein SGBAC_003878 [Bacillariaceae sp.]
MKLGLLSLALSAQAVLATYPASPNHLDGPQYPYVYGQTPPASASKKCALINIAMDESGSMFNEQNFMQQRALPEIIRTLYSNVYAYDDVFVCSNGFGFYDSSFSDWHDYRFLGCSKGIINADGSGGLQNNTIVTSWTYYGGWEEGYYAMTNAMNNVNRYIDGVDLNSECETLDKNMILVTDEDRDNDATFSRPLMDMKADLASRDYILNVVVDATIGGSRNNVGIKITTNGAVTDNVIYTADGAGGYSAVDRNNELYTTFVEHEYLRGTFTNAHYLPLIVDTPGASWNINSLRDNNAVLVDSFTKAFIEVKVQEITGIIPPPTTAPTSGPTSGPTSQATTRPNTSEIGGDPHITTWNNEHYEYHGQCDLVMMKDPQFADGLGLDVHIRTKIVRFWSYIQTVAIRIGNDILEIQGSADTQDEQPHYWINYEYQGELDTLGGMFPVTQQEIGHFVNKRQYKIDLSPKYPGLDITIQLYKEFARVKFSGNEEAFGRTVGLLGDYATGKTLARDGVTVLDDFVQLGNEWQVIPAEPKLFRQMSHPQFPELCIQPEDPRGNRKRRLAESAISVEQAEAACASLNDPLAVKDCVYDILATQDMGMIGAF